MGESTLSGRSITQQGLSPMMEHQISEARMLIARLERLSADSYWAHQASGLRGALLRSIAICEAGRGKESSQESETILAAQLDHLLDQSFEMLVRGAQEMHR